MSSLQSRKKRGDINVKTEGKHFQAQREIMSDKELNYLSGFGNEFASCHPEFPDALPQGQNNPQRCPYGLYAEQLSGTAFTAPREFNRRTWFYRIKPSVLHSPFSKYPRESLNLDGDDDEAESNISGQMKTLSVSGEEKRRRKYLQSNPNQIRWKPFALPSSQESIDFLDGLHRVAGAGNPQTRNGIAIHVYSANKSMGNKCLFNSDGDFLIVPQEGKLLVTTEFGRMTVDPALSEFCVIQQGMKFKVDLEKASRGYILEVFDNHFFLPSLGPIGANGLANPRDFLTPTAWYEKEGLSTKYSIACKFHGFIWETEQPHSPFDVIAWHGNYTPYKYS